MRARGYAGRALEVRHPGIVPRLLFSPDSASQELQVDDLPAMYWFAAAHGRAISSDLGDASLLVQGSTVRALLDRALLLDGSWHKGAIHELYMALPVQLGGSAEKTEEHFAIAMELNGGTSIGPMVSLAESVYIPRQERDEFTHILNQVLEFDPDEHPENRLTNILAQEHALWLLSRIDELFWMDPEKGGHHPGTQQLRIQWPLHF
jgi:predicted anti-sigma-YlaC factor YlaD